MGETFLKIIRPNIVFENTFYAGGMGGAKWAPGVFPIVRYRGSAKATLLLVRGGERRFRGGII
jgi:hypothetical protein